MSKKGVKKLKKQEKKPKNVAVPHESGKKASFKDGTVIEKCSCLSPFQNRVYGPGMRVKNKKRAGGTRCSVCRKVEK